jgi:hypothetical protein
MMDMQKIMERKLTRKQFLKSILAILLGIIIFSKTDILTFYDETDEDIKNVIKVVVTNE